MDTIIRILIILIPAASIAAIVWAIVWTISKNNNLLGWFCPQCHSTGPAKSAKAGSIGVEVALWVCFIIPGVIYSLWRGSTLKPTCKICGCRNLIPQNSPAAQAVLKS